MTSFINTWKGFISIMWTTIKMSESYSGEGKMIIFILFTNILYLNPKHCIQLYTTSKSIREATGAYSSQSCFIKIHNCVEKQCLNDITTSTFKLKDDVNFVN